MYRKYEENSCILVVANASKYVKFFSSMFAYKIDHIEQIMDT